MASACGDPTPQAVRAEALIRSTLERIRASILARQLLRSSATIRT
jgi:hypothetical protein